MNASMVTGHWLIEADLYVTNGVTLQVRDKKSREKKTRMHGVYVYVKS